MKLEAETKSLSRGIPFHKTKVLKGVRVELIAREDNLSMISLSGGRIGTISIGAIIFLMYGLTATAQENWITHCDSHKYSTNEILVDALNTKCKNPKSISILVGVKYHLNSQTVDIDLSFGLEAIAELLKIYPNTYVVIEQRKVDISQDHDNKDISSILAVQARSVLITKYNISGQRIKSVGCRERFPLAPIHGVIVKSGVWAHS